MVRINRSSSFLPAVLFLKNVSRIVCFSLPPLTKRRMRNDIFALEFPLCRSSEANESGVSLPVGVT